MEKLNPKSKVEIWDEFVRGDEDNFKKIFEIYYNGLLGYGTKICQNPDLVKDSIQELFMYIWERRKDLDHIDSPNVYLYVSLRRKILKKLKKKEKLDSFEKVDDSLSIVFSKEDLIILDEVKYQNKEKLHQALNQLTDRQKEVLYLYFYNGMSFGEIEEILSIKRQSVYNNIYRSMEALRSLLDNDIMKFVILLMLFF